MDVKMDKIPFTTPGLEKIKSELNNLKKEERPHVIKAISSALVPDLVIYV